MPPRRFDPSKDTWPTEARMAEQHLAQNLNHSEAKRRLMEKRTADLERQVAQFAVREPLTYGRNARDRHGESYFADLLRTKSGIAKDMKAAQARLAQHDREMAIEAPIRREARQRAADRAYEAAMTTGHAETRALQRMDRLGISKFEKRAISRTDGVGGYVGVPPLWLIDEYVNAPRPGRPFADLWHSMPLPGYTDSVNLPRMVTGTGSGTQPDLAPAPARDVADSFVSARVVTIAGIADAAMQWCEQAAPPGADVIVFRDMMQDMDAQLNAELLLGQSAPALNGIWPNGAITQAGGVVVTNTNNANTSAQTWVNGGTAAAFNTAGCLYQTVAAALSVLNRARGLPPTHIVMPPWLWWSLCGSFDNAGRPLVEPKGHADAEPPLDGAAGRCWSLPVITDDSIPVTFGGTQAPMLGSVTPIVPAISAGNGSYSPIAAVRADDLFLWEGDITTEVFKEVLAGTGQWRFRAREYAASTPSRYASASAISISGTYASGGVNAGGGISFATITQNLANGITSLAGQVY